MIRIDITVTTTDAQGKVDRRPFNGRGDRQVVRALLDADGYVTEFLKAGALGVQVAVGASPAQIGIRPRGW